MLSKPRRINNLEVPAEAKSLPFNCELNIDDWKFFELKKIMKILEFIFNLK
jgi:hypothetical protein